MIILTLIASTEEVISGFPKSVSFTTDVMATVFYTLDGSTPTINSDIYLGGPLYLPVGESTLTLRALASSGSDTSEILNEVFRTNRLGNTRLPHSGTSVAPGTSLENLYPFGTQSPQPNATFTSPANTSYTVNDPTLGHFGNGYDADGNVTGVTNKPYTVENYPIVYFNYDEEGRTGPGIGNVPAESTILNPVPIPETTTQFSRTFDPRAQVIFQDISKELPGDPVQINTNFFSMENLETVRDGNALTNVASEGPSVTGSFVRSSFNPRDNTITYYYYDNAAMRWLISKTPYVPPADDNNLSGSMVFGRNSAKVFQWLPFKRQVLF